MANRRFTDSEEVEIARIYLDGMSKRELARMYGLSSYNVITNALRRQGVEARSKSEVDSLRRIYKINDFSFDNLDNEHTAYWYGFIYADGYVNPKKNTLAVYLSSVDTLQVEKLKKFMGAENPIIVEEFGDNQERSGLVVTSRQISSRLRDLGIVPYRTKFHRVVDNLPKNMYNHWIRGYFDGDGCAHGQPGVSFVGQEDVLVWINETISRDISVGLTRKVRKASTAEIYRLEFGGTIISRMVAEYMYRNATIWMQRKMDVVNGWMKPKQSKYWSADVKKRARLLDQALSRRVS